MNSRLSKEKDIDIAIQVLTELVKVIFKIGLVIVGEGSEKTRLKGLVRRYGLQKHVIFEDEADDIYSYYKTAHLFLMTSRYEDNGQTVLEALACSCPVVTTRAGMATKTLEDVRAVSFVCDVGDRKCFLRKILEFINTPGLREHFKLNAHDFAIEILGYPKEEYLLKYKATWESCFDR